MTNPIENNPTEIAERFALAQARLGLELDFSLKSLESQIDILLRGSTQLESKEKKRLEAQLTAYIGETICRIYQGQWTGPYYGPSSQAQGANFYTCKIRVNEVDFYPSHFISYFLSNGEESEGSFQHYLYSRDQSKGIFSDFLGGGLIHQLTKKK